MDRIRVVGAPGSGKTTTAAAIAEQLQIPHLELDSVHWLPEWEERDLDDFRERVRAFAIAPRWVIDGNYNNRLADGIDPLVDTYVWLDMARWRVVTTTLSRTIRRAVARTELWGTGNRERLSSLFARAPEDNIVLWAWVHHARYREQYGAAHEADPHRWIRIRSRRDIRHFLASLTGHD